MNDLNANRTGRARLGLLVCLLSAAIATRAAHADLVDDLLQRLGSTNEEVRAEAADSLAHMGGARAEQKFRALVASENPEHRQMGVVGLLQVSDGVGDLELVRARLKDDNATVRWSAAVALAQTGCIEALPWLADAAKTDASDSVREAASEGVTRLRASIPWQRSISVAIRQAREQNKPVLAYFALHGSELCRQFEEGVLADKAVVDAVQEFVPVRVNAAAAVADVHQFDVRGSPTLLILDGQGNEMARVAGLVEKTALLARLAEVRRGKLTFREAQRAASHDPADVTANWQVAQTYIEDGREDLAEPHLRNVIAHDEANRYGFTDRALFALGFALGKRGGHAQAAYCFEQVLARWPHFKDTDKTLYCLGLSQLALGRTEKGRAALERLIREFPESSTVANARQALERLAAKEKK